MAAGDITFGSSKTINTSSYDSDTVFLDDTHVATAYYDSSSNILYTKAGTVNANGTITWGSKVTVYTKASYGTFYEVNIQACGADRYVVFYAYYNGSPFYNGYLLARLYSVSGNTSTYVTNTTIASGSSNTSIRLNSSAYYNEKLFVNCRTSSTYVHQIKIFDLTSDNFSTSTSRTNITNSGSSLPHSVIDFGNNTFINTTVTSSGQYSNIYVWDGTLSYGSDYQYSTSAGEGNAVYLDSTHFAQVYYKNGLGLFCKIATVSGTTISFGSEYEIHSATVQNVGYAWDILPYSDELFYLAYYNYSNSALELKKISVNIAEDSFSQSSSETIDSNNSPYSEHFSSPSIGSDILGLSWSYSTSNKFIIGELETETIFSITGSGTVTTSGQADYGRYYYTPSGGITLSGTATTSSESASYEKEYSMTGSVTLSGISEYEFGLEYSMTGGIVLSGTGDVEYGLEYIPTGNITLSGTGDVECDFEYSMTGNITLSGISEYEFGLEYSMTGSVTLSGSATTSFFGVYGEYTSTGGITLSGNVDIDEPICYGEYEYGIIKLGERYPYGRTGFPDKSAPSFFDSTHFITVLDGISDSTNSIYIGTIASDNSITYSTAYTFTSLKSYFDIVVINSTDAIISAEEESFLVRINTLTWQVSSVYGAVSTFTNASKTSIKTLSTTKFIIQASGQLLVGTLSGNTLSYGSEYTIPFSATSYITFEKLSSSTILLSSGKESCIGTISGSTITFGTVYTYLASNQPCDISILSSSDFFLTYKDPTTSQGNIVKGSISSGVISFGTPSVYETNKIFANKISMLDSSSGVVTYFDNTIKKTKTVYFKYYGDYIFYNKSILSTYYNAFTIDDTTVKYNNGIIYTFNDSINGEWRTLNRISKVLNQVFGTITTSGIALAEYVFEKEYAPSGSIVISGSVTTQVDIIYSSSGGIQTSGIVDSTIEIERTGSGVIQTSGSAEWQVDIEYSGSGQVILSGDATIVANLDYLYTPSGGIQTSGSAYYFIDKIFIGSGIILITGSSDSGIYSLDFDYSPLGGIEISGQADYEVYITAEYLSSGNITISGETEYECYITAEYLSSGTIQSSGNSINQIDYYYSSSGNITTSGDCGLSIDYISTMTGNISISGSALTRAGNAYTYFASGIIQSSGNSINQIDYEYSSSGGIQTSGSALIVLDIYSWVMSGNITTSGNASYIFTGQSKSTYQVNSFITRIFNVDSLLDIQVKDKSIIRKIYKVESLL